LAVVFGAADPLAVLLAAVSAAIGALIGRGLGRFGIGMLLAFVGGTWLSKVLFSDTNFRVRQCAGG
jgi:hypothetical protein